MALESEDLRQLEHLAPIVFAFLLRYLTWGQALALALLAVCYALFLSRRLWPAAQRAGESGRSFSPGKVAYAVSVFLLVLVFPDDKYLVAAVWANLSVGDAVSNVVGRRLGRERLPWNRDKSWGGTLAAFLASALAGFILLVWTGLPEAGAAVWPRAFLYAVATSAVCSAVESLSLPVDDNYAITAVGGLFLAWLSRATIPDTVDLFKLGTGLALCLGAALAAYALKTVSAGGAFWGVVQGTVVYFAFGIRGFSLLAAFFLFGSAFSKMGYGRKRVAGIAQEDGGRRSTRHVWGKGLAALLAAGASIFLDPADAARLAFVAALAASLGDTTATELGQLHGGTTVLIPSFRRVARGTRGGVSAAGSGLGMLAAAGLVLLAFALGLTGAGDGVRAFMAAAVAIHVESLLASCSPGDRVGGPMMNAVHTTVAMMLALLLKS